MVKSIVIAVVTIGIALAGVRMINSIDTIAQSRSAQINAIIDGK